MPVVVTGADQPLGRALVLALCEGPGEVRATVRTGAGAGALRAAGARVAVSDLSDPTRLGAVLEGAHTVFHLDRGPDGTAEPAVTWEWLCEAAEGTGLRRIVTVLPRGAMRPDSHGYDTVLLPVPADMRADQPEQVPARLLAALIEADSRAVGGPGRG